MGWLLICSDPPCGAQVHILSMGWLLIYSDPPCGAQAHILSIGWLLTCSDLPCGGRASQPVRTCIHIQPTGGDILFNGCQCFRGGNNGNGIAFHEQGKTDDVVTMLVGDEDGLQLRWGGACLVQTI